MMRTIFISLTIALVALLQGCSGSGTPAQTVAHATECFNSYNYDGAQRTIDALLADSVAFNELTASQLCQVAELCVRIDSARRSEPMSVADPGEAVAARCLSRARSLDPDTVNAFLASLPHERASRLSSLDLVGTFLDTPRDSLVVEDEITDSI